MNDPLVEDILNNMTINNLDDITTINLDDDDIINAINKSKANNLKNYDGWEKKHELEKKNTDDEYSKLIDIIKSCEEKKIKMIKEYEIIVDKRKEKDKYRTTLINEINEIQKNITKTNNDLCKLDKDCIHLEEILKKEEEKKKFFDDKLLQIKSNFKAKEEDLLKKKKDIEDFNSKNSELSKEHNLTIQENEELIISLKEKFKKINDDLSAKKKENNEKQLEVQKFKNLINDSEKDLDEQIKYNDILLKNEILSKEKSELSFQNLKKKKKS